MKVNIYCNKDTMHIKDIDKAIKTFIEMDKKAKIQGITPIYNVSEEEYNKLSKGQE